MKISKGNPEQLRKAVNRQIAKLQGVEECSDITTADDEINDTLNATTMIAASQFPVEDVLEFLASKGYDTSAFEVKSYAEGVANYMDMSREAYEHEDMEWPYTLEQWYKDTQQNYGYELEDLPRIDDVDAACNSCNVMSTQDLSVEDQEKLYELADNYTTSNPVSGDWSSETAHEQQAIADEFGISLEDARNLMIKYLGFTDDMFEVTAAADPDMRNVDEITYDTVEANSGTEDSDPEDSDDYIKALEEKLDKWSKNSDKSAAIASMTIEHDNSALYASVTTQDSTIYSYTVPYDDLSFNDENIEKDMDYIINTISDDLDAKSEEEPVEESTKITASYDEDYSTNWERLTSKSVPDSDGFFTDYTLYKYLGDPADVDDDIYICMFGDTDLYPPSFDYADWSGSSEAEAYEWFESYTGFDDEDYDDIEY